MILFPGPAHQRLDRRRLVEGVVQPAVPFGRHLRGLGIAVVDHPAALVLVVAVAVVPGFVVAVAVVVLADEDAALARW